MRFYTEIVLHAFGGVSEALLRSVIPQITGQFNLNVAVGERLRIPRAAYDENRDQYLSTAFLEAMQSRFSGDSDIHLGITEVDLFLPERKFIIGESSPSTWTAVFSIARLEPSLDTLLDNLAESEMIDFGYLYILRQRTAIEAIHELGHILGLSHCSNPHCVMKVSNSASDWEMKGSEFCPAHRREVDKLMSTWSSQAPIHQ